MGGRTLKVLSGLISRRQSPSSSCAFIPNRVGDGCVGLVVVVVVVEGGGLLRLVVIAIGGCSLKSNCSECFRMSRGVTNG